MRELFITNIHIGKIRHLDNIDIKLSDSEREHLILTGKNGSGKTSLLDAIKDAIFLRQHQDYEKANANDRKYLTADVSKITAIRKADDNLKVSFSSTDFSFLDEIFVFVSAERNKIELPTSIAPVEISGKSVVTRDASKDFLKYILNLDYQLYGAKTDNNTLLVANLTKWFANFENALRDIYACPELRLQRDTKNFAFRIAMPGRESFGLHEMADGYKAFIDILMELLMRMETADGAVDYERSAIVLIDELETHLHVELQKRALPFLTKMFPQAQFVVSTHSPFVISSIDNAVVFDLEKAAELQALGEDVVGARLDSSDSLLTSYSYEDIVEGYYDINGYSATFEREFERYKELCLKSRLTETEKIEHVRLKAKLSLIPASAKALVYQVAQFERKGNVND
ncbi:MAG: AAA family ATPase [Peptococcaceae bacterium]|nr:AAA family ATPase [Peptococcaceae bacterium]